MRAGSHSGPDRPQSSRPWALQKASSLPSMTRKGSGRRWSDLPQWRSGWHNPGFELPRGAARNASQIKGVSAIMFMFRHARRKSGGDASGAAFPDPDKRVFINTDICEGCGDCGVQSNCVCDRAGGNGTRAASAPLINRPATRIFQLSSKGFCPSPLLPIEGAKIAEGRGEPPLWTCRRPGRARVLPEIHRHPQHVVITGIGGTGVVTIGAVLAMAAHLDGKGARE